MLSRVWFSGLLTMSIHDEDYSKNTPWTAFMTNVIPKTTPWTAYMTKVIPKTHPGQHP
jgi:hypothetical protein